LSDDDDQISSVSQFRRFALAICIIGVAVQLALTAYYLSMGHKAAPHHVPVGLVSPAAKRAEVVRLLEQNGYYRVSDYPTADDLTTAIKRREVYGGVDIINSQPHLYVAGAAGPAAANLLRNTFTTVVQHQDADTLADLARLGEMMTVGQPQAITAPAPITDVVPLPADDVNGASLGFLTQALALGGTIASIGLGRLIPRTRRSWKRGAGHLSTLIVYAVGSAAAVLWSMSWFGVGAGADRLDDLYFPDAPIEPHLLVLGLYAGIGCLVVLITNLMPNRQARTSEVELDLFERLEGAEHREPVAL
jgi:hypothetical protein